MADITEHRPRSGQLILEDSSTLNEGDALRSASGYASRQSNFYRAFWYGEIPAATTYYFDLLVPSGYHVWGFTRSSTIRIQRVNSTFAVNGTVGAVLETMDGYRFDERGGGGIAQAALRRIDVVTGADPRSPPMPIVPDATGPLRQPSDQTESGFHPAFDENNRPTFIYENASGTDSAELYLQLSWQELPA